MIIKKKKVRLSAYADIVLLARSEQEIERGYEEIQEVCKQRTDSKPRKVKSYNF